MLTEVNFYEPMCFSGIKIEISICMTEQSLNDTNNVSCYSIGQSNETACVACEPGHYCASPGLDWPTDQCDPGWYCTLGSELAQPSDVSQGGSCVAGNEVQNLNV